MLNNYVTFIAIMRIYTVQVYNALCVCKVVVVKNTDYNFMINKNDKCLQRSACKTLIGLMNSRYNYTLI